jgi:hypothetical protein
VLSPLHKNEGCRDLSQIKNSYQQIVGPWNSRIKT